MRIDGLGLHMQSTVGFARTLGRPVWTRIERVSRTYNGWQVVPDQFDSRCVTFVTSL